MSSQPLEPARGRRGLRRVFDAATVVLFALVRPDASRSAQSEFRTPSRLPRWRWDARAIGAYPDRVEAWHADTFGLRDVLLEANSAFDWFVLGLSPTSDLALGRDGWVFYAENRELETLRGAYPFADQDLLAWQAALEAKDQWCRERGARYLFAIVSNKSSVYPEFLPRGIERGRTRADQLVEWMAARSTVGVIDLLPALLAEKERDGVASGQDAFDRVYRPLGTHWTDRGARAGCAALLEALGLPLPEWIPRASLSRGEIDRTDSWTERLYLDGLVEEREFVLRKADRRAQLEGKNGRDTTFALPEPGSGLPRAVVLHDSFGPQLRPFLADAFSAVEFRWAYDFDEAGIAAFRPDLVIELVVERSLVFLAPQWPESIANDRAASLFEDSRVTLWRLPEDPRALDTTGPVALERAPDGDGLVFDGASGAAALYLPELELPVGASALVRLEVEADAPTPAHLVWRRRDEQILDSRRSAKRALPVGRSAVTFEVSDSRLGGPILLRPSDSGGHVLLRAIEVRAGRSAEAPR